MPPRPLSIAAIPSLELDATIETSGNAYVINEGLLQKGENQNLKIMINEVSRNKTTEESMIDFKEERRKILNNVEDELPPILNMMERANARLFGSIVVGKESKEISELWRLGLKKENVPNTFNE
jgi:hypothetical protein